MLERKGSDLLERYSSPTVISLRLIVLVLLIVVVVSGWGCSPRAQKEEERPVSVEIQLPARRSLAVKLEFIGEIRGNKESSLSFEMGGKVCRIEADMGRFVSRGDVLAALDGTKAEANLLQAEVAFAKAKLDAERSEKLHREAIASDHQLESARLAMEQARANLVSAQEMLRDCTLRAPFTGFVAQRNIELGEVIVPMAMPEPNFVLVDISSVKVEVGIPESEIGKIQRGQKAMVAVSAYPGRQFEGYVSTVSPLVGRPTKTAEGEVVIRNPDLVLKPGMTAQLSVMVGIRKDALVVPEGSVRREVGIATLFVVNAGRAHERRVTTGIVDAGWIEVLSGLSKEDSVVVAGQFQLKENDRVEILGAGSPTERVVADSSQVNLR